MGTTKKYVFVLYRKPIMLKNDKLLCLTIDVCSREGSTIILIISTNIGLSRYHLFLEIYLHESSDLLIR